MSTFRCRFGLILAMLLVVGCGCSTSMTNSLGMVLVKIQKGSYTRGDLNNIDTAGAGFGAEPVLVDHDFWMGITEITQGQWAAIMGNNPSAHSGIANPVDSVSWDDAAEFAKRLTIREGRFYRLPTAIEWEYACRAGTTTDFYFGNIRDARKAIGEHAWYSENSDNVTHAVGTKKPNAWGLYDMSGNVEEWCQGFNDGKEQPVMGGSVRRYDPRFPSAGFLVSFMRSEKDRTYKSEFLGFRVVLIGAPPLVPARDLVPPKDD